MYKLFGKRLFDFFVASIFFVLSLPVFILVTILLCIANGGKPFFFQKRPGKSEHVFSVIKFRTMNDKRDDKGVLLPDDQRITTVGSFVRKTSLDEIPQLLNVIIGDMSLVGPRPLLVFYLPLYNDQQKRRHELKPGITGWAQVNGRNAIDWQQKFEYDVWYIDHCSFALDMKIIFKTVLRVFKSDGINKSTGEFMEPFSGNN